MAARLIRNDTINTIDASSSSPIHCDITTVDQNEEEEDSDGRRRKAGRRRNRHRPNFLRPNGLSTFWRCGDSCEAGRKQVAMARKTWSSYRTLYSFADHVDIQLMILGLLFTIVQAILPSFVWYTMGSFVTSSVLREAAMGKASEKTIQILTSSVPGHDAGLNSSDPLLFYNQTNIDKQFAQDATPIFIRTLVMSVTIFVAAFLQRLAWEVSGIRQVFRVKKAYIRKLLHMDVAWLESRHSGQVASMLHDHADSIYHGLADHIPMSIFIFAYLIATLSVCFYIQWDVTMVMLTALPLLIVTRLIFSKWFCKTMDEELKLQAKITNLVQETFSCIRTVISFAAQKQTMIKYERLMAQTSQLTEERLTASSVYDALAQVLLTELIFTAALCYGIWKVGPDQSGALIMLAINMLYMCVTSISIGFHLNGASSARTNSDEIHAILDEAPSIECEQNSPVDRKAATIRQKGRGAIVFDNVRFAYPSRPEIEVLKGITFRIEPGEHIAIVGSSGSGKSTITALILRFYDPQSGSVMLDGCPVKKMDPDDLRVQLGLVSQEPVLFEGTISDNIRYGKLDAQQAEINDAARKAEAWHFISSLPDGMQTQVGDRGTQLSGGQKQRVAIARAVIRDPSVMIFDEATSALDSKHEVDVQKAIDAASEGVTTITIAHRLSTVRNADRIIVLEAGEIIEQGPPEKLLSNREGRFSRMHADQKLDDLVKPASFDYDDEDLPPAFEDLVGLDLETRQRAWARSSLAAHKKLGKSYSVRSTDRERLALPVMSKKRRRLDEPFNTNVMEVVIAEKEFGEDNVLPGKTRSFKAFRNVIKGYRKGYVQLAFAIPVTILRGVFFLLVCFEVAYMIEIALTKDEKKNQEVFKVAAIFIALIIIKTMFEAVGRLFVALYGHGLCGHLRGEMFRSILRHGCAYFDDECNSPGRLTHKVVTDTASLNRIVGEKLDLLLPAIVCSIVSVSIACFLNWNLALLCGFQFPAFFLFRLVELRETGKRQRQMIEEEKKAANLATVVLSNMSTIKAYTLQEHFNTVFCDALKPIQAAMKRQSCISAFVFACQFSFAYILIAITLHFGKEMMLHNRVSIMDFICVVLLTQFGANFLSQMIASVTDLSKARVAAENIVGVIEEKAMDMNNLSDEGLQPKVIGEMRLNNVEFRYPTRPVVPVLKSFSLTVTPGQSIALVGPSGCGKSTVLHLMQRMYSPNVGVVSIDNVDVRNINPGYLRRVVVSVGQEPTLFSFTLRENIAYGLPEDEWTQEKIVNAAKTAHVHDFIVSLPQGYDTEIGEFGHQLSGGQKQRIAIARAMIREPVVLLLDEATAALDSTSEKAVQSSLEAATKNCTCIHVAHRLSSIRNVDKIIVLVEGQIAEAGTHQELMAARGLYYEMNRSDF